MNIKIEQSILMDHLNHVIKGLSSKNLIPILNCIKIEVTNSGIELTTTNNDISIRSFIKKEEISDIVSTGTIVVFGRFFYEIIRKLPNEIISIEEVVDNKINIYTNCSSFYLNCNDQNDFPNLNFQQKQNPIVVSTDLLKNIVNKTLYATSTSEERPNLTGLNIKIVDNKLICTATDSYRVARKEVILPEKVDENVDIIIPNKNISELIRLLTDENETVEMHIFNNNVLFKFSTLLFISRLINGSFPDVSTIIPTDNEINIKVDYSDFYNAIDRASLLSKEESKQTIKLEILANDLIISSIIPEIGKVEEKMNILNNNDKNLTISFSSKYMLDTLKSLNNDTIDLFFNNYVTPIVVKSDVEEDFIQLFQPIRTH